jgi:anti-sigma factor RsiW
VREAMSNEELMRFLDGELSPSERARMEEALSSSTELQRELSIYRALQEEVRDLSFAIPPDRSVWDTVDRRLTRPVGWILLTAGAFLWMAFGAWVFATSNVNVVEKLAVGAVVIGFLILLTSTILERAREWRTDPYRDIQR